MFLEGPLPLRTKGKRDLLRAPLCFWEGAAAWNLSWLAPFCSYPRIRLPTISNNPPVQHPERDRLLQSVDVLSNGCCGCDALHHWGPVRMMMMLNKFRTQIPRPLWQEGLSVYFMFRSFRRFCVWIFTQGHKTHKHKQICGIVPDWGGGKTLLMCFYRVIPYGGNKIPPPPNQDKNPRTILRKFCSCVFLFVFWLLIDTAAKGGRQKGADISRKHPSRDVIFSGQNLPQKCQKVSLYMTCSKL